MPSIDNFILKENSKMLLFEGIRYNYRIIYDSFLDNTYGWTLYAFSKFSYHVSGINNLNPILSELGLDIEDIENEDGKYDDSGDWIITKKELNSFNKSAKSFLSDLKYLEYLENKLDEDRSQGEWDEVEL